MARAVRFPAKVGRAETTGEITYNSKEFHNIAARTIKHIVYCVVRRDHSRADFYFPSARVSSSDARLPCNVA
jgi:hypothetical protein